MANMPPAPAPTTNFLPAKSWQHFVAGGLGGMAGAVVTSPFDVVKTRLQSDMFRTIPHTSPVALGPTTAVIRPSGAGGLLWNFVETGHIIRDIYKYEGVPALFKGLGPTLVGVVPARSINFFTYGNGKQIIARKFNDGKENSVVHLSAAAIAGVVTATATNPIWVVKTRMQLSASGPTPFTSAFQCTAHILRHDGIPGLYKGLSASYLGVTEGVIQWVLYERLKIVLTPRENASGLAQWAGMMGAAGGAKFSASLITYPHEVIRTRLRQPLDPVTKVRKYRSLIQTLRLVIAEEGAKSLYGGLSAHLLRVVPNAAVMYTIYEGVLLWGKRLDKR